MEMYFSKPIFHAGKNCTVRRGIKWDCAEKDNVLIIDSNDPITNEGRDKVIAVVDIETRVLKFEDISITDISNEHDPSCRTLSGLIAEMRRLYAGFDTKEIVTIVSFDMK